MMVKVVAAADAAAGAIDAEDHGLDVLVFHGRVDRPLDEAVLAFQDDALDRQDDDLVLGVLLVRDELLLHPRRAVAEQAAAQGQQNEIQEERPANHHHEKREEQPPPESSAGWRGRWIVVGCIAGGAWGATAGCGGGVPSGWGVVDMAFLMGRVRCLFLGIEESD